MRMSNEIQEGIGGYFDGIEEKRINENRRETERAEGLLYHILNNLSERSTFSILWILEVYNSNDKRKFNEEEIRKLMDKKRVYGFMNHQISLAMGGYSE